MKKLFVPLIVTICACSFFASCAREKQAKPTKQAQFDKIQDVGGDQTDIFAIPLDTSEFEEEQEEKTLEKIGERDAAKAKAKAQKAQPAK